MEPFQDLLIGVAGALLGSLVTKWLGRNRMQAIDTALEFARKNYFHGSTVKYRNTKWRRLGLGLSIMVDVCGGRARGVYIIVINRDGLIRKYYPIRKMRPHC
jgi:hypothetical protein